MQTTQKKCLYEILGVAQDATSDEIKKQYRKLAFTHHPDRNHDNVEEATELFHKIQDAYEVLTDPHERAWYDQNRAAILRSTKSSSYRNIDVDEEDFDFVDILQYFSSSCYNSSFDEKDQVNFYSVYDQLLEKLVQEELEFSAKRGDISQKSSPDFYFGREKYPKFGGANLDPAKVTRFYKSWTNFSTQRTFSWENKWDMHDASNRYERRYIEKENDKLRNEAKKKFESGVKELIGFIQKRDPRWQKIQREKMEQEELKKKQKKEQAEREELIKREMQRLKMEELKRRQALLEQESEDEDDFEDEEDPDETDLLEDDLMAYYQANTGKGKKKKKFHELVREEPEEDQVDEEEPIQDEQEEPVDPDQTSQVPQEEQVDSQEELNEEQELQKLQRKKQKKSKKKKPVTAAFVEQPEKEEEEEDDRPKRVTKRNKKKKGAEKVTTKSAVTEKTSSSSDIQPVAADGDESAEQQEQEEQDEEDGQFDKKKNKGKKASSTSSTPEVFKCNVCDSSFSSKNKLFQHVKEKGHAIAVKLTVDEARKILETESKKNKKNRKKK